MVDIKPWIINAYAIDLDRIEMECERAEGVIVDWQIEYVREAAELARFLPEYQSGDKQLVWALARHVAAARANGMFNAVLSKGDIQTGRAVRKPFIDANTQRSPDAGTSDANLQRLAKEKWKQPLHRNKSATDIAKLIDPAHWNTTRRKIKKPKQ